MDPDKFILVLLSLIIILQLLIGILSSTEDNRLIAVNVIFSIAFAMTIIYIYIKNKYQDNNYYSNIFLVFLVFLFILPSFFISLYTYFTQSSSIMENGFIIISLLVLLVLLVVSYSIRKLA